VDFISSLEEGNVPPFWNLFFLPAVISRDVSPSSLETPDKELEGKRALPATSHRQPSPERRVSEEIFCQIVSRYKYISLVRAKDP